MTDDPGLNINGPREHVKTAGAGFLLALALVAAALHLPSLGTLPFDHEEARRALPAREMLRSGNWIVPTIWSRPYLAKPPLFYWMIAVAAGTDGVVDEVATRLPSVLATIATALAVAAFGARIAGRRTGRIAGFLFLCTLLVLEKGNLGELEAVFGLAVFLSLALLWIGSEEGGLGAIVAAGVFLGLALLTKGPPTFVFWAAALVGLVRAGRAEALRRVRAWLPLAIGIAIAAAWFVPLFAQLDSAGVIGSWGREVTRSKGLGFDAYLLERVDYLVTVLLGLFPASLVCAVTWRSPAWRRVVGEPFVRFALVPIVAATAFFFLTPGTRTRYIYPLVPLVCLVAARVIDEVWGEAGGVGWRRLRFAGYAIATVGVAATAASVWLVLGGSIGDVHGLGLAGIVLVVATLCFSVLAVTRWRSVGARLAPLVLSFAILAALRLLQLVEIVPQIAATETRIDTARRIEAAVPASAVLGVTLWDHFNTLAYVRRDLVWKDLGEARPGDLLLVDRAAAGVEHEPLLETTLDRRREVSLVRVLASSDDQRAAEAR